MEYDFSRIRTEYLRIAVDNQKKGLICNSITCCDCPFREFNSCYTDKEFRVMFEKELYRRDHPYTAEDINNLIMEETMEEYKDITLDMSVREIMELDPKRIEVYLKNEWIISVDCNNTLISGLKKGYIYRYKLKPLEPIRITKKLNDLMFEKNLTGAVYNNKVMIRFEGSKVEIIGEEK